jgi:small subunit ribosomal protein S17
MKENKSQLQKKSTTGLVVKISGKQSRRVQVERLIKFPIYGKYVKRSSYFIVHDQDEVSEVGDVVSFQESAPISKRKTARIVAVISKANKV